ncbi:MAG: hypothetical protein KDK65_02630 [Chlamydiia bacterium]|nr:hypothetical protein [Chlamydiia bacterium]
MWLSAFLLAAATVHFTPPEGWRAADTATLPPTVKVMVVGKGKQAFPPSLNLGVEPFEGSLSDYLAMVKEINRKEKISWRDLGTIETEMGRASLSQIEVPTEWGHVRMMHAILLHDQTIYNLTAAALKEEFPTYYTSFFTAMRSLALVQSSDHTD